MEGVSHGYNMKHPRPHILFLSPPSEELQRHLVSPFVLVEPSRRGDSLSPLEELNGITRLTGACSLKHHHLTNHPFDYFHCIYFNSLCMKTLLHMKRVLHLFLQLFCFHTYEEYEDSLSHSLQTSVFLVLGSFKSESDSV